MVIPTANQANKPVSDQNVNPEKQTFSSVYVAAGDNENLNAANVHHDENYGNTRAGDANVPHRLCMFRSKRRMGGRNEADGVSLVLLELVCSLP